MSPRARAVEKASSQRSVINRDSPYFPEIRDCPYFSASRIGAHSETETAMPKANVANGEIYYETHGTGEPLLLVSGLGGVASYWNPNLPGLSAKYRVIVHDHRGTGQSTHSQIKYSVEQMTDDLVRLMDHLKIARAHLVGHSTGGAIGQTLALRHPQRLNRMVLFATWPKADYFFRKLFAVRREL